MTGDRSRWMWRDIENDTVEVKSRAEIWEMEKEGWTIHFDLNQRIYVAVRRDEWQEWRPIILIPSSLNPEHVHTFDPTSPRSRCTCGARIVGGIVRHPLD